MSVIFAPLAGGGWVNLAHIVSVTKDNVARMDNGPPLQLDKEWELDESHMAFTGAEDCTGFNPLVNAVQEIQGTLHQIQYNM